MSNPGALTEIIALDQAIERLFNKMAEFECHSKEYITMADQLAKLYKMKEIEYNYALKRMDANNKQKEIDLQNKFKSEESLARTQELQIKQQELELTTRLRNQEMNLKETELDLKERETDASCLLKAAETREKSTKTDLLDKVSLDTWAIIGGNLLGIALIIGYEKANVLTSKAVSFVMRLK